jgi:integrase
LKAAGIGDYVRPFHDLRHTSLTNEAASGSGPIALMAKAGHTNMKVTRQYLHLAGVVFRDEAAALERRLFGPVESSTRLSVSEPIEHYSAGLNT